MNHPTLEQIEDAYRRKKFPLYFTKGSLNIFGVRNETIVPDKFDDVIGCIYTDNFGVRKIFTCDATTDPGLHYLKSPMNSNGCAILIPGYYKALWKIGSHKGAQAFVQATPCTVTRDFDKDNLLDFRTSIRESGMFGIDLHGVTGATIANIVNRYSAGCQVVNSNANLAKLLTLGYFQIQMIKHPYFSYALFEQCEIVNHS